MKIISSVLATCIASLARFSVGEIDEGDGKCDYMFVECEAVCEFTCSNRPEVVELGQLASHPEVLSAIPWSNLTHDDLLQVDRSLHKPAISDSIERVYNSEFSELRDHRAHALEERFVAYGKIAEQDPGLFSWSCFDHCKYECMNHVVKQRGTMVRKYFGKWPFRRVFVCQEMLSSLYSLLNGLPYMIFALTRTFRYRTPPVYRGFTMIVVCTWILSAIFHCRDTPLTMHLDYFSAFGGVVANCATGMYQTILHNKRPFLKRVATMVFFVVWALHSLYLALVNFDYDWNMTLAICIAIVGGICWFIYYWRNRTTKPHAWIVAAATLALLPLLVAFELNDFPPGTSGLADAHSYWHLSTVPISVMWVVFMYRESVIPKSSKKSTTIID